MGQSTRKKCVTGQRSFDSYMRAFSTGLVCPRDARTHSETGWLSFQTLIFCHAV